MALLWKSILKNHNNGKTNQIQNFPIPSRNSTLLIEWNEKVHSLARVKFSSFLKRQDVRRLFSISRIMTNCSCYYTILGINKPSRAGQVRDRVKANFLSISRLTHPDVVGNFVDSNVCMILQTLITQAKTVLENLEKEREYLDRKGNESHTHIHKCVEYLKYEKLTKSLLYLQHHKPKEKQLLVGEFESAKVELERQLEIVTSKWDERIVKNEERLAKLEQIENELLASIRRIDEQIVDAKAINSNNHTTSSTNNTNFRKTTRGRPRKRLGEGDGRVACEEQANETTSKRVRTTRASTIDPTIPTTTLRTIEQVFTVHCNKNGVKVGVELPVTRVKVFVEDFNFFSIENSHTKLKDYFANMNQIDRDKLLRKVKIKRLYLKALNMTTTNSSGIN